MEEQIEDSKQYEYYVVGGGLTLYPPATRKLVFNDDELKNIALEGKMKKMPSEQFAPNKTWEHGFAIYENLYDAAYRTINNNHSMFEVWPACSCYCPILKIKTKAPLTLSPNLSRNDPSYVPKTLQLSKLPSDSSIEEIYLQGYYPIGSEKHHKETLDQVAEQPAFTAEMLIGLFTLIGIIPILIYAGYRKYKSYQANKLISQAKYLFEKTATSEWQIVINPTPTNDNNPENSNENLHTPSVFPNAAHEEEHSPATDDQVTLKK